jgi:hypothetical protein
MELEEGVEQGEERFLERQAGELPGRQAIGKAG